MESWNFKFVNSILQLHSLSASKADAGEGIGSRSLCLFWHGVSRIGIGGVLSCLALWGVGWGKPPDTVWIGWPCTLRSSRAALIPTAERLATLTGGRLVVRYWNEPQAWPSSTAPLLVGAFPFLPDTGYPRPDYTIPELPAGNSGEGTPSFLWPLLLALLLGGVLLHRVLGRLLRQALSRLYWRLRWEAFLWKYPPRKQIPLSTYAVEIYDLLMPYCDFHPGSLLPAETRMLSGPTPLVQVLQTLIPPFYEERFLQKPLSPEALRDLYQELYAHLKQARSLVSTPHRHRICLCRLS